MTSKWNEFSAKLKELEENRQVREAQRPPEPTSTPPLLPPPCPPLTMAQIRATLAGRGWKEDAIEGAARLIIQGRRSEGEERRNAGQVPGPSAGDALEAGVDKREGRGEELREKEPDDVDGEKEPELTEGQRKTAA